MGATEYVTDINRFYEILLDDRLDNIQHINELNENMLQIDYKYKDCYVENYFNTNIGIHSCFYNCKCRLRLYEMSDILGESVVYYDTDSIVYTGCLKNGAQSLKWLRYLKSRVKFRCQFFFPSASFQVI
jgi:hypothetical protein